MDCIWFDTNENKIASVCGNSAQFYGKFNNRTRPKYSLWIMSIGAEWL